MLWANDLAIEKLIANVTNCFLKSFAKYELEVELTTTTATMNTKKAVIVDAMAFLNLLLKNFTAFMANLVVEFLLN